MNSTSSFQAVARLGKETNSRGVEVSPDGGLIYVTNFEAGLVQVYSITSLYTPSSNSATGGFALTFEPVTAYSVGDNPEAVVFSAAAQVALVANSGSNDVTVINFESEIPVAVDTDSDGLFDDEEAVLGTDPNDSDSDDDGLSDGDEVKTYITDPRDEDSDDDGLTDGEEVATTLGTDPNDSDSDDDGLSDGDEVNTHTTDPLDEDSDGDGLTDGNEVNTLGTLPNNDDTDGDGLKDGEEVNTHGTDPKLADTDGDSITDSAELAAGTDPLDPNDPPPPGPVDTDGDGLSDDEDLAPLDPTEWFHVDGVHDTRETIFGDLVSLIEELTSEPVEFVSDDSEQSTKSEKASKKASKGGKSAKAKSTKSNEELGKDLLKVAEQLYATLDSTKWVSTMQPTREDGNDLFNRDREAVKKLEDLLDDNDELPAFLSVAMDSLASLDYAIAVLTVDEAEASCGGSRSCTKNAPKARKDLDKAFDNLEDGDFEDAIAYARKAWNRMAKYLPGNAGKGGDWDDEFAFEDDEEADVLPAEFTLDQNYPNPFNPTTTIEFALPEAANVSLVVYDAIGRQVQVLVNGPTEAGRHSVRFNAADLPSGLYLYRISAGSFTKVQTMMLVK